jgi:hypothetical protein
MTEQRRRWGTAALALTGAAMLVLSVWFEVGGSRTTPRRGIGASLGGGALVISTETSGYDRRDRPATWDGFAGRLGRPRLALLPERRSGRHWNGTTFTFLTVPLWPAALVLAAPSAWFWLKRRLRPKHACRRCGYDLRGSVGPACPECGAPPP